MLKSVGHKLISKIFVLIGLLLISRAVVAEHPQVHLASNCQSPLCFENQDASFQFKAGVRLQLDRSWFRNDDQTDFNNSWNTRRARLNTVAKFGDNWTADITYDFARDGLDGVRDAYLKYTGFEDIRMRLGHFKEPFGMERLTSVRDLAFMERSLVSLLTPERALGVEFLHHSLHHTAAIGLFKAGINHSSQTTDFGSAARVTFAPKSTAGNILHVGTGIAYRKTDSDNQVRFQQLPETRGDDLRLIDTGRFLADDYIFYGIEAALAKGSVAVQSEYIYVTVHNARLSTKDAGKTTHFKGWHIDLTWILTGEPQPYNHEKGTLGRLKPFHPFHQGGTGAWKVGIRLSELDLNNAFITGGEQRNLTTSLTWLWNEHISFISEYVKVLDINKSEFDGASPSIIQARMQIVY